MTPLAGDKLIGDSDTQEAIVKTSGSAVRQASVYPYWPCNLRQLHKLCKSLKRTSPPVMLSTNDCF
jgi:hypothetical protein